MKKIEDTIILFVATGMFSGFLPVAPGTFGSILGAALAYGASKYLTLYQSLGLLGILLAAGVFTAGRAEIILHEQDSGKIVIDEIAGMYITMLFLPMSIVHLAVGFVCFRIMDIVKPFPISSMDRHIHGGTGVMLDDVAAGLASNVLVRIVIFFIEIA